MSRFQGERILFVTGRLAESALRRILDRSAAACGIDAHVQVMPITVAALMTPDWIGKHLQVPEDCDRVLLPGYCGPDVASLAGQLMTALEVGPRDLRDLPEFLGHDRPKAELDVYDVEIIAEINYAPRLAIAEVVSQAAELRSDGADLIDLGCQPGHVWKEVGVAVRALRDEGHRVSIDSLNPQEIEPAVRAGAELVLSVNSQNLLEAIDWGCEVVVIPDDPTDWQAMEETIQRLANKGVPLRIDPILEPVGLGFAESLHRYFQARKTWPEAEMMMGIGNVTELSDVDSAGLNFLLLAVCQDLNVRSVLTTQVINWARSSVKECDLARRLVCFAQRERIPAKNVDDRLVCLRDARLPAMDSAEIDELAEHIRDDNYRVLAECGEIHLLGGGQHWQNRDAFRLFDELMTTNPRNIDASHAFYLGYEMCKATIAQQLGKHYCQDESLDWGHLTVPETTRHRLTRTKSPQAPPK